MTEDAPKPEPPDHSSPLAQWWHQEKHKLSPAELQRFLHENRERLEKSLAQIHDRALTYRISNRLFALFAVLAGWVDWLKNVILQVLIKIPAPARLNNALRRLKDGFSFQGIIEFLRVKLYSLRKAPHNLSAIHLLDDIVDFAKKNGLDFNAHFPDIEKKFLARKQQFLQHSFFTEFTKSRLERLLAIPFAFHRSIAPVLSDSALWHKFFVFLEHRYVADLILVDEDLERISFKRNSRAKIESSSVVSALHEASELKASGQRIFIIGHHEGYVGPYIVRSVLRQLGFDNLAANCNTVVGPRMFSNIVLQSGARNVGNLFLTLPSKRTTEVKQEGLAEELQKSARRTQFLIKMPNAGLKLIEQLGFEEFKNCVLRLNLAGFAWATRQLDPHQLSELQAYLQQHLYASPHRDILEALDSADYELFKKIMYEPFLLFPEGSRSYVDARGAVTMKYVNPRFMQIYLRPGDFILPLNLVGGSDITKDWHLSRATLGLAIAKPYAVTAEMIEHYEVAGLNVMRTIAALPNIKPVHFDEAVQAGLKFGGDATSG